jgi:hypothetical protein
MFPKGYQKEKIREKFRRYRILFFAGLAVFFVALIGEMFLYGAGGSTTEGGRVVFGELLVRLITYEGVLFLCAFLFGVTLYAPFFQYLALGLRGAFCGFVFSVLLPLCHEAEGILMLLLAFFYFLFSTALFCGYASFCSATALRIFTDSNLKKYRIDEKGMFGGTLFNSTFFCNTVNLRFLFSYCLIFFCAFFFLFLQVLIYAFFRSLIP